MWCRGLNEVLSEVLNEESHHRSRTKLQQPAASLYNLTGAKPQQPTVSLYLTAHELHVAGQEAGDEADECLRHPTAHNLCHHLQFHISSGTMVCLQTATLIELR